MMVKKNKKEKKEKKEKFAPIIYVRQEQDDDGTFALVDDLAGHAASADDYGSLVEVAEYRLARNFKVKVDVCIEGDGCKGE